MWQDFLLFVTVCKINWCVIYGHVHLFFRVPATKLFEREPVIMNTPRTFVTDAFRGKFSKPAFTAHPVSGITVPSHTLGRYQICWFCCLLAHCASDAHSAHSVLMVSTHLCILHVAKNGVYSPLHLVMGHGGMVVNVPLHGHRGSKCHPIVLLKKIICL